MKDEVLRNIVENYEKFKIKTKDEVSSFNHNSSKSEIFCNPGAKIIYQPAFPDLLSSQG